MTTIDDLMYRAYPVLRHYSPQAMALLGATGLTAERFAAITGVDVAAAAEYECATPTPDTRHPPCRRSTRRVSARWPRVSSGRATKGTAAPPR